MKILASWRLVNQLETLKEAEVASWNLRGMFLALRDIYAHTNGKNYTDGSRKNTLNLYTGFPYERGRCGNVTDAPVLDQWRLCNGTFIHNGKLFPLRTPENFHACQNRVVNFGTPPFNILTGHTTYSDGNIV
jgi:hypothetical protein